MRPIYHPVANPTQAVNAFAVQTAIQIVWVTGNVLSEYLVHTETSLGNVLSESGDTLTTELVDNLTWTEIITTEHEDTLTTELGDNLTWTAMVAA